jgi:3-oxoacyl-[acyl-carrier protein] reductase
VTTEIVVLGSPDGLSAALADRLSAPVVRTDTHPRPNVDAMVIVAGTEAEAAPIIKLDGKAWDQSVHAPMWRTVQDLQRAHSSLRRPARLVLVTPTIGLAGASHLVAYTTVIEGIRAMTKSAARQWAADNIRVNLVAAPLHLFVPALAASAAHLTAAPVAADSSLLDSVAQTVEFLLRPDVGHLVGETIVVDGGSVMLP